MTSHKRYLPLSRKGFAFEPFEVPNVGASLSSLKLSPDLEIIVFARGRLTGALIAREMAYHHVAQGEIDGHQYLVSF